MSKKQREKAVRDALKWLRSPEGLAEMKRRAEIVEKVCVDLRKCRDIPHELLHRPFTI